MCLLCASKSRLTRRHALGLIAATTSLSIARSAAAEKPKTIPKPQNVVSPDEALKLLMAGNARYVDGVARRHDFKAEREPLTRGQNPYAAILGCADSRIAPEYAFDAGRGDLFVCRVAGNIANDDMLASLEYAVTELGTKLILVLGHDACGAVSATIKSLQDKITLPGHLPSLVQAIAPAVEAAKSMQGNLLDNAIKQNVLRTAASLRNDVPVISRLVGGGKLRIAGGIYRLGDGQVDLVA